MLDIIQHRCLSTIVLYRIFFSLDDDGISLTIHHTVLYLVVHTDKLKNTSYIIFLFFFTCFCRSLKKTSCDTYFFLTLHLVIPHKITLHYISHWLRRYKFTSPYLRGAMHNVPWQGRAPSGPGRKSETRRRARNTDTSSRFMRFPEPVGHSTRRDSP